MASTFEVVLSKLPSDSTKANIIYNLSKLESEENRDHYKNLVVEQYYKGFPTLDYLFYPPLYSPEIDQIHTRISYTKHDMVIREGTRCKHCKGTNTHSVDEQRGGGDEYIPTRVTCYDCNKQYRT
jgi:DNA-directed RNA polymerase subunit M/transcription elongation factor TFIIS